MNARVRNLTERRDFGGIVIVALVGAAVAVKLAMNFASGGAAYAPAAVAAQSPVHLSGSGTVNTAPFQLVGGDYAVDWSAAPAADNMGIGCYHAPYLTPTSGGRSETIVAVDVKSAQAGTAHLYGVAAGSYYVYVISGCGTWAFYIR
jgi:hypothetical protein